jgi:hypothetical protein
VEDPESLCARILKAKYFHNCSCLEAKKKRVMSYTWRSLLQGIELLKKGIVWRIGDGQGLNIWRDPWLPWDNLRRPFTMRGNYILQEVSELIDPTTGSWDTHLVGDIFWPEDAVVIKAITVHEGMSNRLAWHYDTKGKFSVRSAYKVCRQDQLTKSKRGGASSSAPVHTKDMLWKKMWKQKCPNKVKHFLWRFAHNSHPLRCNLKRKKMQIDTLCPVCNRFDEDGSHLFYKCKHVRPVWNLMDLGKEREALSQIQTPKEALEYILSLSEKKKMDCILLMWFWWTERNNIREGGIRRSATTLSQCIRSYANEIAKINQAEEQPKRAGRVRKWTCPEGNVLKLNCDASFHADTASGGWGAVIRDADGDVVWAGRGRLGALLDVFQAETIACLQGIQAALNLGITRLILETDAEMVQRAITTDEFQLTACCHLLSEVRQLADDNLHQFSCVAVPRSCNRVAHSLAALGCVCSDEDDPVIIPLPDDICNLVASEMPANE